VGPPVKLSNKTSTNPSFTAPTVPSDRELRFSLTAKDDRGTESEDPAIVTVLVKRVNCFPMAIAGQNQTVNSGDIATLDGSYSKDPDDGSLTRLMYMPDSEQLSSELTPIRAVICSCMHHV